MPSACAEPDPAYELQRQRERDAQLREEFLGDADVRIPTGRAESAEQRLPEQESPCFQIERIILQPVDDQDSLSASYFYWAVAAANTAEDGQPDPAIGRCLGGQGVAQVVRRIQNAIIERGYVTTRVLAAEQNLASGRLTLTLIPGRVRQWRTQDPDSPAALWNAFPRQSNNLLNLRAIEQGLENLKRLPSVEADINLYPSQGEGSKPGDSDLVVSWQQKSPFRFHLALDNSGSESTGSYLGSATISYDNPLHLNDLLYYSFNHDLGGGLEGERGTRGQAVGYSLPFGYWQLTAAASRNSYHQTVRGAAQDYQYSGRSNDAKLTLSRLVYRDSQRKTKLRVAGWLRSSQNYINDTEIEVQRRRMVGWELGLNHQEFIKRGTLDLDLVYKRGTGALNAMAAPEELFEEGTSRPAIIILQGKLSLPFELSCRKFRYQTELRAQWNQTSLVPQDRFSIGSRYTVRGFDGEALLSAERGWLLRNDLLMQICERDQWVYLGLDYGEISGPASEDLIGTRLAGVAVGIKGRQGAFSYDASLATALEQPDGFDSADYVFNFRLGWTF